MMIDDAFCHRFGVHFIGTFGDLLFDRVDLFRPDIRCRCNRIFYQLYVFGRFGQTDLVFQLKIASFGSGFAFAGIGALGLCCTGNIQVLIIRV